MEYLETIPGSVYMIMANGAHYRNHDHGSLGQHFINKNQQWLVYSERYKTHTPLLSAYLLIAISLQWRIQELVGGGSKV